MIKVIITASGKRWDITSCIANAIAIAALIAGAWIISASIY